METSFKPHNKITTVKYLAVFSVPILCIFSLFAQGWWTYATLAYVFGLVPLLELFIGGSEENFAKAEEAMAKEDKFYDWMLYLIVPIQYVILLVFLFQISEEGLTGFEITGRIIAFGIVCGGIGINVAHELGHRSNKSEQTMSKMLLLTSLYMHFFIEHNQGHHKNVATEEDPASAKKWDVVYIFWIKSVVFSYLSAWKIELNNLKRKGVGFFSIKNEMLIYTVIQLSLLGIIVFFFGIQTMIYFICAAVFGFLLLETVNYIEHYGLRRKQKENSKYYERVLPAHSWNSNHYLGRILLFELSRHSDHHFDPRRKYQVLQYIEESPQMPLGYPGMMVLSLFPPLFFMMVHPYLNKEKKRLETVLA